LRRSFILQKQSLLESRIYSQPSDPAVGPTPKVLSPNDSPRRSPIRNGVSRPSRIRSQVFATSQRFLSNFELRELVSSHSRPGFFPLQRFPLAEIAHLSRGRWHPCSYPRPTRRATARSLSALISPTPTLTRDCLDPPAPMSSLLASKPASKSPWGRATKRSTLRPLRLLRRFIPSASPFEPTRVAPRRPPILSWSLRLSEAFSVHTSGPRTRPTHEELNMPPRPKACQHDPRDLATPCVG